jgi:hypothetical protein
LDEHNFSSLHATLKEIQANAALPQEQRPKEVVINITIHPACAQECIKRQCKHEDGKAAEMQPAS